MISEQLPLPYRIVSMGAVEVLTEALVNGTAKDVVYFVGAGVSAVAPTRMPTAAEVVRRCFVEVIGQATSPSAVVAARNPALGALDEDLASHLAEGTSFEYVLDAIAAFDETYSRRLFEYFARAGDLALPNACHRFLARWIERGGTVVTTNYDELIERCTSRDADIQVRTDPAGIVTPAASAGALVKLHGTASEPESCLGALRQVGLGVSSEWERALDHVLDTRALVFLGWRGVDPDLEVYMRQHIASWPRTDRRAVYWVHYEGQDPSTFNPTGAIAGTRDPIDALPGVIPIVSEAGRLCQRWCSLVDDTAPGRLDEKGQPSDDGTELAWVEVPVPALTPASAQALLLGAAKRVGGSGFAFRIYLALSGLGVVDSDVDWADRRGDDAQLVSLLGGLITEELEDEGRFKGETMYAYLVNHFRLQDPGLLSAEPLRTVLLATCCPYETLPYLLALGTLGSEWLRRRRSETRSRTNGMWLGLLRARVRLRSIGWLGRHSTRLKGWVASAMDEAVRMAETTWLQGDGDGFEQFLGLRLHRLQLLALMGDRSRVADEIADLERLLDVCRSSRLREAWPEWRRRCEHVVRSPAAMPWPGSPQRAELGWLITELRTALVGALMA